MATTGKIKTIKADFKPVEKFKGVSKIANVDKFDLAKSNLVTVQSVIPKQVKDMLNAQFNSIGLKFDLDSLVLNKDNKETIKSLNTSIRLIKDSQALLPQLKQAIMAGIKAAKGQARFNRKIALECLKVQGKIEDAEADVLLALAGYSNKKSARDLKLEYKLKRLDALHQANANMYGESWGKQAQVIDARYVELGQLAIKRMEVKQQINQLNNADKIRRLEYTILD